MLHHQLLSRSLAILAIIVTQLVMHCGCTGRPRSDAWMRRHLQKNETKFVRLVQMSNYDHHNSKVIRIADDFTRLEDNWAWPRPADSWGITESRWDEYRALFRELKLPAGLQRGGNNYEQVLFMFHGVGLGGSGQEYGLLWTPNEPVSLDEPGFTFKTEHIQGDWYLYDWDIH